MAGIRAFLRREIVLTVSVLAAGAEEPWQEPMCERLLFAARECMKKRT